MGRIGTRLQRSDAVSVIPRSVGRKEPGIHHHRRRGEKFGRTVRPRRENHPRWERRTALDLRNASAVRFERSILRETRTRITAVAVPHWAVDRRRELDDGGANGAREVESTGSTRTKNSNQEQEMSKIREARLKPPTRTGVGRWAIAAAFGGASVVVAGSAEAQVCPIGRHCFYVPAAMPDVGGHDVGGHAWDFIISTPIMTATGTFSIHGGAGSAFTVMAGSPLRTLLGAGASGPNLPNSRGVASNFRVAEQRGIFVVSSDQDTIVDRRLYQSFEQSSETVKRSSVSLGTRFRLGGYSLNGANFANSGYDYVSVYAPTGATVTLTAPPGAPATFWNDGAPSPTTTVTLTAGQTYALRTAIGVNIDGALLTSTDPVSVSSGGRGWSSAGCGDDGADHLVPTNQWGTDFVVVDMPGTNEEETVIVADTNGTTYTVNRTGGGSTLTGTLNAGQVFRFLPANQGEVQRVTTNNPVAVFHNTGLGGCELDVAFVLPAAINAAAPRLGISFNVPAASTAAQAFVVFPDTPANAASLRLNGTTPTLIRNLVAPGAAGLRVQTFNLAATNHVVELATDFQLGVVTAAGGTGLYAYYSPYRTPGCGNRAIDPGESCDDGNTADGDGCSSSCRIEVGFTGCMGLDARCVPTGRCEVNTCVNRCMTSADCDDANACTADACNLATGTCSSAPVAAGTLCTPMGGGPGACGINGAMMSVCLTDSDGDRVPDLTDADDDNDGLPDTVESGGRNPSLDSDADGIPDFRDATFPGFVDANANGVDDRVDLDGDRIPNHLDLDSDADGVFDLLENGHAMLDADRNGRLDGSVDADADGFLAAVDANDGDRAVVTPRTTPVDTDRDGTIDALDTDDDGDGVLTRLEVGAGGPYAPLNTDGTASPGVTADMIPNWLDDDDDGDGLPTRSELGAGGAMSPQNTDGTVPAGQGASDTVPDYLDGDDDGDGIPTGVERTLAGMAPDPDGDMIPAWLDRDADGDTVFDVIEAGATPSMPANSDMDPARDFLDTDSDNDCLPDRDAREAGAARTNPALPSMNANNNCPSATPVCTIATGVCAPDVDTDMDGIPNLTEVRIGSDPMNPDTDGDGVRDGLEVGPGPDFTPRDTDGDRRPDFNDGDDDGDGVNTADELGPGGAMSPRNSNAMVPAGQGTSDMIPDYLDPDDDGDDIPTSVERALEAMGGAPDMDMTPAYLDLDSDGDGIPDAVELGLDGTTPRNSDGADRPDFLDLDSDNDTVDDGTEAGPMPLTPRNSNAMVPAGEGMSNSDPDYIDQDDDGDGIPTSVEVRLEGMTPGDADMIPAHLDRDSDGDGVLDLIERGPNGMSPANSDPMAAMPDRPDFLDTDSDNDCVLDGDPREAGAARTNPALPNAMRNANCVDPMLPICSVELGRCVSNTDLDGDGIPNDIETRLGTNPMNPDSDMDGVPDGREVGDGPDFMGRDTDMDGTIDALDPDDDGDGIATRDELGAGGFMTPRNSDAMVPAGEGESDMRPDYLDPDDDGDGIPTRVEARIEGMTPGDADMIPAYLDRDSDGDGVFDAIERGADGTTPADSDGTVEMGGRPDFLDTDSDNDCVPDSDPREAGAARTDPAMPSMSASANCTAPTPVCDRSAGRCIAPPPDGGMGDASPPDGGPRDGGTMDAGSPSVTLSGDGACTCRVPAAGHGTSERAMTALATMAGLALAFAGRRRRAAGH
jgi:cysteine-rich repeat protein